MSRQRLYTFADHRAELLKNAEFKKDYEATEPEYLLAKQLIEKRLKKNMSQRDLAKRLHTSQAVISRIERMKGNPSLGLLKRIASELDTQITFHFR